MDSDRRPHVAIAVLNLPAERDRRVIRECLALESAGYRVTVICPRGESGLRILPGSRDTAIRAFRQPFAGSGILSFATEFLWSFVCVAWHLSVLVVRDRVVAAQVCNPPDVFWPLALVMRMIRRPWIFDHHDLCPELYLSKSNRPGRAVTGVLTVFEKLSMRCATEVISTNESFKEIAISRGGCRPELVTVVRNGPSAREIAPAPPRDSTDPVKRIAYLGVINAQDHVDVAVRAAEQLAKRRGRTGWEFVIAGDGECLAGLRQLVEERGLGGIVRFTGWLGAEEVDALLRDATIGIQPDQPNEMNNLSTMAKTVEYLARGLPVVAVDLRETRRSAEDAAVYVPTGAPAEFAEAIDALLDDDAALAAMRKVAEDRFQTTLAWEHQAKAYVEVWRRLVPVPGQSDGVRIPRQRSGDLSRSRASVRD